MRMGEAYTFVPAAFGAEIGGKDTKTIPRRVTGPASPSTSTPAK